MTKVLFIENSAEAIEDARQLIDEAVEDSQIETSGFEEAEHKILSFDPDVVILDLEGVPNTPRFEGFNLRDFIWDNRFCPIVVYSAFVEDYEAEYEEHPLIKTVQKGSGSPQRVLISVQEVLPVVQALRETRSQVDRRFWEAMKEIAPIAVKTVNSEEGIAEVIIRCGRRRIAATMDIAAQGETPVASWEQYLYPPVSEDPELGDILKTSGGDVDDPDSFRLVLTPSCDMVSIDCRAPKTTSALVAKCRSTADGLEMINMQGSGNQRHKDKLQTAILNQGFYQSAIPIPRLIGAIPSMVANLRDLQLIPIDQIGPTAQFHRVASIDSPFRETVAWAYMQISCRPGLPDRDTSSWADEIVEAMNQQHQARMA